MVLASVDEEKRAVTPSYPETYRRMLLDMHVPAWHPSFLSKYEPADLADLYSTSGTQAVLLYCKSHLGLNYWPAPVGGVHPAAAERNLVAELLAELESRDIAAAAYHSVVYDNWAALEHPEWRIRPAALAGDRDPHWIGPRYGTLCPNNLDYRAYERAQITALLELHEFSTIWFDMTFWTGVCVCAACETRWRNETGRSLPRILDWASPVWADFQAARERWMSEFVRFIFRVAKEARPEIDVVHNMASALLGWFPAQLASDAVLDAFPSGDHAKSQIMSSKLMSRLATGGHAAEYMTSRTTGLVSHVAVKSEHRMLVDALSSVAGGTAFLFIDAIDPVGTLNRPVYEQMGRVFAEVSRYDQFLAGEPVEDVMLYYSDQANINPHDNGRLLSEVHFAPEELPHMEALEGLSRALQQAHLTFGVISRHDLGRLSEFRAIMLPDVLRMTDAEIDAFRGYVEGGGSLYASGRTSLLNVDGNRHDDFQLADVFGCSVEQLETGEGIYLRSTSDIVSRATFPERYLEHGFIRGKSLNLPRLAKQASGQVLARVNLPYGYPSTGSMHDADFASIHSSPPWDDLENPAIVENRYGAGRCVYSSVPLEVSALGRNRDLVAAIAKRLLGASPIVEADTHESVFLTARSQPTERRVVICLLRKEDASPAGDVPVLIRYRPPSGQTITSVVNESSGEPCVMESDAEGLTLIRVPDLRVFALLNCAYATAE
jgi:Alpha-L-fucosidase